MTELTIEQAGALAPLANATEGAARVATGAPAVDQASSVAVGSAR